MSQRPPPNPSWADSPVEPDPTPPLAAEPRIYRGRPENQRDPRATNGFKPRMPKANPVLRLPASIPKPTRLHDASSAVPKTAHPSENSVFSQGISVSEVTERREFSSSTPALIDISRSVYAELLSDDSNLGKTLLPEYVDYYATALLWFRYTTLKQKFSQPMTEEAMKLNELLQTTSFCVPKPLAMYYQAIGMIESQTGEHLFPASPDLPTHVIAGVGGYHGSYGPHAPDTLHTLYEEIPCLGVLSYAVQQAISAHPPGAYQSTLTYNGQQPKRTLLGFRPLGHRRSEPKNLAFENDISEASFPSFPANTSINMKFILAISNILAHTKTFRNDTINFPSMSDSGSWSQTIPVRPQANANPSAFGLHLDLRPTSFLSETPEEFGKAIFFSFQLFKNVTANNNSDSWSIYDQIPNTWIDNRNHRRDLPDRFYAPVFDSISMKGDHFRTNIVRQLVISQR